MIKGERWRANRTEVRRMATQATEMALKKTNIPKAPGELIHWELFRAIASCFKIEKFYFYKEKIQWNFKCKKLDQNKFSSRTRFAYFCNNMSYGICIEFSCKLITSMENFMVGKLGLISKNQLK